MDSSYIERCGLKMHVSDVHSDLDVSFLKDYYGVGESANSVPILTLKAMTDWMGQMAHWQKTIQGPIIHVGMGGSVLGPKCLAKALGTLGKPKLELVFWSSPDLRSADVIKALSNPNSSVIFVSKSMTTHEMLQQKALICKSIPMERCYVVTANPVRAIEHGFSPDHIITFPDWVSGRFSAWGPTMASVCLAWGQSIIKEWLEGGVLMEREVMEHQPSWFLSWIKHAMESSVYFIAPYGEALSELIPFVKQIMMESLGKAINQKDQANDFFQYVMGDVGPDFQHASLQILAEDPRKPVIDIWVEEDQQSLKELAFSQVLSLHYKQANSKVALGVLPTLSPKTLGAIMALYELKALVLAKQFVLNPFNQPGVEQGKQVLRQCLNSPMSLNTFDDWQQWYLDQSE